MSFFFRMASRLRPSTPEEVVRSIKDSFLALHTRTHAKALEEVEKNISSLRLLISVLWLQVRKDLVHCWCILLRQKVDENYCCVQYIENHLELLDFLVGWALRCILLFKRTSFIFFYSYKNLDIALNCGNMLRECIKYPTLAKYILESGSFELFFEYVELPNFDIASDALNTFKDLLTKHETVVAEFLGSHYDQFFELYSRLLSSTNYVTRRQAMKDSSKNIRICAFHVFKVFVANPNKPRCIIEALLNNRRELLKLLHNLPTSKGDDELDEEKELIIQQIQKLT
nr:unnamed protein product [Digitaria exilis]